MYFGEPQYRNARRSGPDPARKRLISLVVFLAMIGAAAAIGPSLLSVFRAGSQPPNAVFTRPPAPVAEDLEPGEVIVPLHEIEDREIADPPPPQPPEEFVPRPEILRGVGDDSASLDRDGLAYLFQMLRGEDSPLEEFAEPFDLRRSTETWWQLVSEPDAHRGEPVIVEGTIVSPEPGRSPVDLEGFETANPSGLERYFRAFVHTGEKYYMVAFWKPPGEKIEDRMQVQLRGLFLQLYRNQVEHEGKILMASVPVLVGNTLHRIEPPATGPGLVGMIVPLACLLIGLFLAALVVSLWVFRSGSQRYEERLREARQRLGVKKGTGSPPTFQAPSAK